MMSALRRLSIVAMTVGLVASFPGSAGAAPSVALTGSTLSGSTATVTGTATFPAITAPQDVGGTNTQFANAAVADAAGINLTKAEIVPLANNTGLRFIWHLNSMPAQVPPEGVRYLWAFGIVGTQSPTIPSQPVTFQLQAKRTNVASVTTTEDPQGHALHAAKNEAWFQLRGACEPNYLVPQNPVQGCYHLAFLQGTLDVANKRVTMDLPYQTRDRIGRLVAPEFKPGVQITPFLSGGSSIAGSFQAVVSNTTVSDYINNWNPYFAGPQVALGAGPQDAAPEEVEYTTQVTLKPDGTFSGAVTGITGLTDTVYARACNGTECSYTQIKVN